MGIDEYTKLTDPENKKVGIIRDGKVGEAYFTDRSIRTADRARDRLALPRKPEIEIEFKIKSNLLLMERNGTKVSSDYGQRGGGKEFMTLDEVEVEIVNMHKFDF